MDHDGEETTIQQQQQRQHPPRTTSLVRSKNKPKQQQQHKKKKTPVHQYHEALQFLMTNPAPEHAMVPMKQQQRQRTPPVQPLTTTTITTRPATRIGLLANYFRPVLQVRSDKPEDGTTMLIIDMDHLLSACHRFERAMVAVGQSMAAKDLRHNLVKVEQFQQQQQQSAAQKYDLRSLLLLELQQQHNPHLRRDPHHGYPLLAESSCAMGLLWIRRSLTFQCRFYRYLTEPLGGDAQHAALQAYRETLQSVHGWALQKLHVLGIQNATPERRALLARLGGFDQEDENHNKESGKTMITDEQEQAVQEDLRDLVQVWEPLLERWEEIFEELDLEDLRKV